MKQRLQALEVFLHTPLGHPSRPDQWAAIVARKIEETPAQIEQQHNGQVDTNPISHKWRWDAKQKV